MVNRHNSGQRLDRFLRKAFPAASLSLLFAIIRKKKVRVNGIVGKSAQMLCENDEIKIYENMPQQIHAPQQRCDMPQQPPIPFIFKNADFAIINKPCGLASQSGTGISEEQSLAGMLDIWAKEEGLDFKPALVHRLDKETSGLIIAALSGPALREFGSMLRARKIRKEYLALVKGKMPQKSGKITMPLPGDEKISESIWKIEKSFEEYDCVRVRLETGRKHQIRIHFAQIGHPLLGDTKYGDFALNRKLKIPRLFLHSTLLEFMWQGEKMKFEAELPQELESYVSIS